MSADMVLTSDSKAGPVVTHESWSKRKPAGTPMQRSEQFFSRTMTFSIGALAVVDVAFELIGPVFLDPREVLPDRRSSRRSCQRRRTSSARGRGAGHIRGRCLTRLAGRHPVRRVGLDSPALPRVPGVEHGLRTGTGSCPVVEIPAERFTQTPSIRHSCRTNRKRGGEDHADR
jgi:hypothetical protein